MQYSMYIMFKFPRGWLHVCFVLEMPTTHLCHNFPSNFVKTNMVARKKFEGNCFPAHLKYLQALPPLHLLIHLQFILLFAFFPLVTTSQATNN